MPAIPVPNQPLLRLTQHFTVGNIVRGNPPNRDDASEPEGRYVIYDRPTAAAFELQQDRTVRLVRDDRHNGVEHASGAAVNLQFCLCPGEPALRRQPTMTGVAQHYEYGR